MKKNPHNLPEDASFLDVLKTKLATVYFYENIVVFEAQEGAIISHETALQILQKGIQIMKLRPLVYISNRIHSYSVNPTDFKYLEAVPTIKGFAFVNYTMESRINAQYEANFFKKPFQSFDSLEEAYHWAKEILATAKK
ncbi:MAG: hypothetical protein R2781_11155 [Flavobacteriaceae bacterium]